MRFTHICVVGIVASMLCSCGGIYSVHLAKNHKLKGIPFYALKANCQQKTVWLEPVYTLSYLQTVGDKEVLRNRIPASAGTFASKECHREVATPSGEKNFLDHCSRPLDEYPQRLTLAANSIVARPYLDYSRQYTYNVRKPGAGSANGEVHLSKDGSLDSVRAETNSTTIAAWTDVARTVVDAGTRVGGVPIPGLNHVSSNGDLPEWLRQDIKGLPDTAESRKLSQDLIGAFAGQPKDRIQVDVQIFQWTVFGEPIKPADLSQGCSAAILPSNLYPNSPSTREVEKVLIPPPVPAAKEKDKDKDKEKEGES